MVVSLMSMSKKSKKKTPKLYSRLNMSSENSFIWRSFLENTK